MKPQFGLSRGALLVTVTCAALGTLGTTMAVRITAGHKVLWPEVLAYRALLAVPAVMMVVKYPLLGATVGCWLSPLLIACSGVVRGQYWHTQPWFWVLSLVLVTGGVAAMHRLVRRLDRAHTQYRPSRHLRRSLDTNAKR